MKNQIIILITIIFSFLSFGCSNKYYKKEQVKLLKLENTKDSIILYYTVPLETIYYSSGIDLYENKITNQNKIRFVRQKINSKIKVNFKSELITNKNILSSLSFKFYVYKIIVPIKFKNDIINSLEVLNAK